MMERDAARADKALFHPLWIEIRISNCADKHAVLMMAGQLCFMRTRHHQHTAVLFAHHVDGNANRQQVVVGMRIKCPILVPFHRCAVPFRFHVQLVAIAAYTLADQLLNNVQDAIVA